MAIPNNFRHIIVQGKKYRWQVKDKPIFRSAIALGTYLSVELIDRKGKALLVDLTKPQCSNFLKDSSASVKPKDVSEIINYAIQKGWKAEEPGITFRLNYSIR
jgi:hypothetical protein